jgi:hypothetical protein
MKLYLYVHHHLEACANVMIVNRQNKTIKKKIVEKEIKRKLFQMEFYNVRI